ncbi:16S rRNA (guanine(527)-N(7))-methyltransferase RsmG [Aestuariibacter sp. AA17]|uniref:Ribosomal RNA small subunit methyltransferase G n=1 Tax=Fluctibacter corallii TaxID=2984329 RepID=A0ABT3ACZ0_9ALTE|nr:16S rRNA (guanine(527)-N(7))-methyltransferase RsmG [Aestuariibacter sp. AA17]MCV2886525.1 16S rRNA (guanine(527)-N(7))-methyltransferase RsmG [Aestuariibacter sp. AA17]
MQVNSELLRLLKEGVVKTSLTVTEDQLIKLVAYVELMDKWNKAYNLTSVRDPKQMLVKHILDSIVVAPHLSGTHFIDVGTGPGLPGIPLAIMCPDKHFVLLDSLGKRVRFMKQVKFALSLNNIDPVQSRVELYQPEHQLDGVLSRAFASLKDMLHWCQHLVDSKGAFLALKGQFPEDEIDEISGSHQLLESIVLSVPELEGERHLLKIVKK